MTCDVVTVQLFWVGKNKTINEIVKSDKKTDKNKIRWRHNAIVLVLQNRD